MEAILVDCTTWTLFKFESKTIFSVRALKNSRAGSSSESSVCFGFRPLRLRSSSSSLSRSKRALSRALRSYSSLSHVRRKLVSCYIILWSINNYVYKKQCINNLPLLFHTLLFFDLTWLMQLCSQIKPTDKYGTADHLLLWFVICTDQVLNDQKP